MTELHNKIQRKMTTLTVHTGQRPIGLVVGYDIYKELIGDIKTTHFVFDYQQPDKEFRQDLYYGLVVSIAKASGTLIVY